MIMSLCTEIAEMTKISCPSCEGDAIYRYGRIKTGSQRFKCMVCGTQFTPGAGKAILKGKPLCPDCGKKMNVYKLEGDLIRFRCSGYPDCRTFRKFRMKEEK